MKRTSSRDLLEEKGKIISKFYHEVYDWLPWFEALSDSLPPHSVILDFGCGEGNNLNMLVNKHKNWYGVGIDISREVCTSPQEMPRLRI